MARGPSPRFRAPGDSCTFARVIDAPNTRPPAFRIPDTMPVCERVALMTRMAEADVRSREVAAAAATARAEAGRYGWVADPAWGLVSAALAAVQALPYRPDPPGEEWLQPAWYTLRPAVGGDCNNLSIALASVCFALGVPAQVVWITQTGQAINHVTVAVWAANAWRWAEPAVRGALLGESPYAAVARTGAWNVVGAAR